MERLLFLFYIVVVLYQKSVNGAALTQPEQVHLSLGKNIDEMVVTWATMSTSSSSVEYGIGNYTNFANGTQTIFQDGGDEKRNIYIHRATLMNLIPKTDYVYRVGGDGAWSAMFSFRTLQYSNGWAPRFAIYGDMGYRNARALPHLQKETENNQFDIIKHVGDFAYNLETDNAQRGDEFMRKIEPVASHVPYMTSPGNHERAYNFSNYKARFSMPGGDRENQFYSYNVGPAHFISFSSEFYYYPSDKAHYNEVVQQFQWLTKDLEEANKPLNRLLRPWIIAMGHRPMYCSNSDHDDACLNQKERIRVGISTHNRTYGLEDLFYHYGVDVVFAGHEHTYERMWPVYNWTVCNTSNPYVDPPSPIFIVTGSAGSQERHAPFIPGGQPWSAFRNSDYGYSRVTIFNSTHLYLDQLSTDQDAVVDQMWLVKHKHGAGLYTCHRFQNPFVYHDRKFVLASSLE